MAKLGRVLALVDRKGQAPYVVAAVRLMIFTGARHSEILTLKWEYVNEAARLLRLPDSKTGAKAIPLAPPALAVMDALPRRACNPYVICGAREGERLINLQEPWRRLHGRVVRKPPLAGFEKLLRPGIVEAFGDALAPAQFGDRVFAQKARQDDPDLLFG